MSHRVVRALELARPAAQVPSRVSELFGEALPELFLLSAIVAAVVGAALALHS